MESPVIVGRVLPSSLLYSLDGYIHALNVRSVLALDAKSEDFGIDDRRQPL